MAVTVVSDRKPSAGAIRAISLATDCRVCATRAATVAIPVSPLSPSSAAPFAPLEPISCSHRPFSPESNLSPCSLGPCMLVTLNLMIDKVSV